MKKIHFLLSILPLVFLAACKASPEGDEAKTGEARQVANVQGAIYQINTTASSMEWIGTKLSTYHPGEVEIKQGELIEVDGKLTGGKFVIDMSSIIAKDKGETGVNDKLTGHLKSPDFFDAATYPEATFEITGVKVYKGVVENTNGAAEISEYKISDPNYLISGNLKIKNITKNIEFPANVTITDTKIEAVAKFNIDRKLWDITYTGAPDDLIQDMIWFGISLQADKKEQTASSN